MIDDKLTWEAQINYLKEKLLYGILVIKRIKKFIPESKYMNLYSKYKIKSYFYTQKRCVRLLFGNELNFDHAEYYQTCVRATTYQQHKTKKNFLLEHTKPIFNDRKLLSLHHLYIYHSFLELFLRF